jgi:hypothetical protein
MNLKTRQDAIATAGSVLAVQVAALLEQLERFRDRRCREIRQRAEDAAREIERGAWRESGVRGRVALRELRQRMETERQRIRAFVEAETRRAAQHEARCRLEELHEGLPRALAARWSDPAARASWINAAVGLAHSELVSDAWRIEHPVELDPHAIEQALARLARRDQLALTLVPDARLDAGIVISSDGAVVDASSGGLLANTARIESSFLAQCQGLAAADGGDPPTGPDHG